MMYTLYQIILPNGLGIVSQLMLSVQKVGHKQTVKTPIRPQKATLDTILPSWFKL